MIDSHPCEVKINLLVDFSDWVPPCQVLVHRMAQKMEPRVHQAEHVKDTSAVKNRLGEWAMAMPIYHHWQNMPACDIIKLAADVKLTNSHERL